MKQTSFFFLCAFLGFSISASASADTSIFFDRLEGSQSFVITDNGKQRTIQTSLYELKYIAALRPDRFVMPYFLFSARPCANCSNDEALYLIRPDVKSDQKVSLTQFVYPGKILDPKSKQLVFEGHAFVGQCLPAFSGTKKNDHYVVFQKEKVDRRASLQRSVFIAEAKADRIYESLLEKGLPRIEHTQKLVKNKTCIEIEGKNRIASGRALDITPKLKPLPSVYDKNTPSIVAPNTKTTPLPSPKPTTDDDEEDAPPKENQTDKELPVSPD